MTWSVFLQIFVLALLGLVHIKETLCLVSFCASNLSSLIKGREKERGGWRLQSPFAEMILLFSQQKVFSTVLSEALNPGFSEALIEFTK